MGGRPFGCSSMYKVLFFHDLQDLHGAGLDADAAGDALGGGILGLEDHDLHGAGLNTGAAGYAQLLVDHVNAGLGILGDGAMLTGLHALAALDAGHGLGTGALSHDLDAAVIRMELLVEGLGASLHALKTCHALRTLFNHKLLHKKSFPFSNYFLPYYTGCAAK